MPRMLSTSMTIRSDCADHAQNPSRSRAAFRAREWVGTEALKAKIQLVQQPRVPPKQVLMRWLGAPTKAAPARAPNVRLRASRASELCLKHLQATTLGLDRTNV